MHTAYPIMVAFNLCMRLQFYTHTEYSIFNKFEWKYYDAIDSDPFSRTTHHSSMRHNKRFYFIIYYYFPAHMCISFGGWCVRVIRCCIFLSMPPILSVYVNVPNKFIIIFICCVCCCWRVVLVCDVFVVISFHLLRSYWLYLTTST